VPVLSKHVEFIPMYFTSPQIVPSATSFAHCKLCVSEGCLCFLWI